MTPSSPRDPSPTPKPSLSDRWYRLPRAARIGLVIVVGIAALAVAGNVRSAGVGTSPPPSAPAAAAPGTASVLPDGQIGPGVHLVGTDVAAGTYRTAGAIPGQYTAGYCFWNRNSSASGEVSDIIASDGARPGEPLVVTVEASDVTFETNGCEPWVRVG
jgi:hypothetical protein